MPRLRLLLQLAGLLACAVPCFAEQPQEPGQFGPQPVGIDTNEGPVPGVPTPQQLEAAHAHIGKIVVHVYNVFNLNNPGDNNWLYRLADRLHLPTRPSVIRAQLLFHSGEPYSLELVTESARNIRQNSSSVREPVIRAIAYHNGVVDLEVITHDVWTLQPGVNFSRAGGANSFGFQFSDANFLGTGKYIEIGHSQNVDRSSNYIEWSDPNVGYSHWVDGFNYAKNSDGTVWGTGVSYPFYSLETPLDAGVDIGNSHSVVQRYRLGESYDSYANDWRTGDLYLGEAVRIDSGWTDRLLVGFRVDDSEFSRAPGYSLVDPLPADRNLSYPFVRFQWTRNNYVTIDNLALIARTEDVHLGLDASIGAGYAAPIFDADRHSFIVDSELADVFAFGGYLHQQQVLVNGRLSTRFEEGAMHDGIATGNADYYLATSEHTRFYASLTGEAGHNLDGDHFFDLGGDDGLRGYPLRYQNGNQLGLLTFEERLYTNWFPFRLFNVGAAAFYDMGRTWGTTLVPNPQLGLLKDVGMGLRLGNARSSFGSVVHIDVAMPLDRYSGISRVQFLVTTQQTY